MIEAGMQMIEAGLAEFRAENELSKARMHIVKAETTIESLGGAGEAQLAELRRLQAELGQAHPTLDPRDVAYLEGLPR